MWVEMILGLLLVSELPIHVWDAGPTLYAPLLGLERVLCQSHYGSNLAKGCFHGHITPACLLARLRGPSDQGLCLALTLDCQQHQGTCPVFSRLNQSVDPFEQFSARNSWP